MPVLVTGATGFIGRAIVRACVDSDLQLRTSGRSRTCLDDLPNYQPADIRDLAALTAALHGVDSVIHAAGLAHQFGAGARLANEFEAVNVKGSANVLRAAANAGVGRVVFISSIAVYGDHQARAVDEEAACSPRTAYAVSKLESERVARDIAAAAGIALTVLRVATVYGEGDPGNVGRLLRAIRRRRFVWIGTGQNRKSLIHKDDLARACLAVLEAGASSATGTFNVSGPACFMHEVVDGLALALGVRVPPVHVPARLAQWLAGPWPAAANTVERWLASDAVCAGRFGSTFSYEPSVALAQGLRRQVAWEREHAR